MKSATNAVVIITSLSLAVTLANFLAMVAQIWIFSRIKYREMHGVYEDDPYLEVLPMTFEEVSMTVQENHQFSLIDDKGWAQTLPGKRGFVRLGPKGRSFALGVYHQLHCVNALRFSYTVARDGLITDLDVLKAKIPHDNHCFQFIRQNIQCRAESSIIPLDDNQTLSNAGFGAKHRCRNWAQVREFIKDNDAKWDDIPYLIEGEIMEETEA